jgi:hypothetical protein
VSHIEERDELNSFGLIIMTINQIKEATPPVVQKDCSPRRRIAPRRMCVRGPSLKITRKRDASQRIVACPHAPKLPFTESLEQ